MEPPNQKLTDVLINKKWIEEGKTQFLFTAYRMINFGSWESNYLFEFENMRIGLVVGEINYPFLDVEWDVGIGAPGGKIKIVEETKTRNGGWLLFSQPYEEKNSAHTKQILSSYCAMFITILGRQVAYEKQFHYIHDVSVNKNIFDIGPPLSPNHLVKLNLSEEKIKLVKRLALSLQEADPVVRSRLLLSLHWFEKGVRSKETDAFLNFWIALEALAMPDTTDIKEIKITLARLYGLSEKSDSFAIGKLFGMRSRIVHKGEIATLDYKLGLYMEAIYADVLLHTLGLEPIFKTKNFIQSQKFDVEVELDKLAH